MTDKNAFLEKILEEYAKSFDIVRDYEIGGIRADAYGYFSAVSEKYVLSPKANLWSIHGFEHILFFMRDTLTLQDLDNVRELMHAHMAPELVCKGKKYPEKDHMYSYLTVVFLCDHTPDENVIRAVKSFRYEKDYLFTLRGHTEGHIVLMDMSGGKVCANRPGKHLIPFYEKIYSGDK